MFRLSISGNPPLLVSEHNDPTLPDYQPIFLQLDSTPVSPADSEPVECEVSLDAGHICNAAQVSFVGTLSEFWEATPQLDPPAWGPTATISIPNNVPGKVYVRAKTTYGEVPLDDRSVSVKVEGEVEKV